VFKARNEEKRSVTAEDDQEARRVQNLKAYSVSFSTESEIKKP
jgi:hypothetical protein